MIILATKGLFGQSINIATHGKFYTVPIIFEEDFWQEIITNNSEIFVGTTRDSLLSIGIDIDTNIKVIQNINSQIANLLGIESDILIEIIKNSKISDYIRLTSNIKKSVVLNSPFIFSENANIDEEKDSQNIINILSQILANLQRGSKLTTIKEYNSEIFILEKENSFVTNVHNINSNIKVVETNDGFIVDDIILPSFATISLEIPTPLQDLN